MFLVRFPLQALGTNVHVLAAEPGGGCVVVDPGIGCHEQLRAVLDQHRLVPEAVLLTHGHVDHVYGLDAVPGDVPVHIHADDAYRLVDPVSTIGPDLAAALSGMLGPWRQPDDSRLRAMSDGDVVEAAGLSFTVAHAPGHTEGSVLLTVDAVPDQMGDSPEIDRTLLSGDVLFAGSVGRTDLPGGDPQVMARTLAEVVLGQPDTALVLPGHGPATTVARERAGNPFLVTA